jgi:hypothetical protein
MRWFNRNRFTSILRIASASTLVFAGAAIALVAATPSAPDASTGAKQRLSSRWLPRPLPIRVTSLATTLQNRGKAKRSIHSREIRCVTSVISKEARRSSQKVRGGAKIHDYAISFNGFAAKLTDEQAAALETRRRR